MDDDGVCVAAMALASVRGGTAHRKHRPVRTTDCRLVCTCDAREAGVGRAQQRGPWVRQRHLPPCRDASIGRARERASTLLGSCGIGGGVCGACGGASVRCGVVGMRAADDVKIEAFV